MLISSLVLHATWKSLDQLICRNICVCAGEEAMGELREETDEFPAEGIGQTDDDFLTSVQIRSVGRFTRWPMLMESIFPRGLNVGLEDIYLPIKRLFVPEHFEAISPLLCNLKGMSLDGDSKSRGLSEPGTLFKDLMAILRDVFICYDGTVRNSCSNEKLERPLVIENVGIANIASNQMKDSGTNRECPKFHCCTDFTNIAHDWPGLPRGVKFDPTDQEILWHLLPKVCVGEWKPHPFINEFIPTVESDDGICYPHPKNLPGVKQDGSVYHFFHRAIKAYNTGTRKRRKIQVDDSGDVRWHKTGKTKPVALYTSEGKGAKAEKTNWVMHQYQLGTGEDEREGENVISKIFYQQQSGIKGEKNEDDISENIDAMIAKVDPVTPQSVTPEPFLSERRSVESNFTPLGNPGQSQF